MLKLVKACCWEGVLKTGQKTHGTHAGRQFDLIRADLQRRGIVVTQFQLKWRLVWMKSVVSQKEIAQFTQQLAHLLNAGFPLMQGLNVLIQQYSSRSLMSDLVNRIKIGLEDGMSMNQVLQRYPEYFSPFYCALVRVSEQCGRLPEQLLHLASYQEKLLTIKQKVHRAFYYPLVLLSVSVVVMLLMILFVVPQFEALFIEANTPLPRLTYWLIQLAHHLHLYLFCMGIMGFSISIISLYLKKWYRLVVTAVKEYSLRMPWIGVISQKMILVRFSHTLMMTLSAGLPMTEGLLAAAEVVQYNIYKHAILKAHGLVMEGIALDQALASTGCFPDMMLHIINTGQMTGRLVENFAQLADYFEEQLNESLNTMTSLLEPMLLLLIGCVIGGLMLALYWPIFELGTVMGSI